MQQAKQASIEFSLRWQSAHASHTERLYDERVNIWRDFFPGTLGEQLAALPAGGVASQSFAPGELLPAHDPALIHAVRPEQIRIKTRSGSFTGLGTETVRDWQRPHPLYVVWGRAG